MGIYTYILLHGPCVCVCSCTVFHFHGLHGQSQDRYYEYDDITVVTEEMIFHYCSQGACSVSLCYIYCLIIYMIVHVIYDNLTTRQTI